MIAFDQYVPPLHTTASRSWEELPFLSTWVQNKHKRVVGKAGYQVVNAQCLPQEQDPLFSVYAGLGPYTDGAPEGFQTWESSSYLYPGLQV